MLPNRRRVRLPSISRSPLDQKLELMRNPAASAERRMVIAKRLLAQGHYPVECLAVLDALRRRPIGRA